MIIKNAVLETVCGITSTLPVNLLPEIALAGKSNVGKSSLINCLINRKNYARTSAEPGKTRTINYYKVNDAFYYVDLPGYGYAKVSKQEQEKWGTMIERYLNRSGQIKSVFLLVDSRRTPSADDRQMFDWICNAGYRPVVVATKIDKLNRAELTKATPTIRKGLGMLPEDRLILFSSETKKGAEEILSLVEQLVTSSDVTEEA